MLVAMLSGCRGNDNPEGDLKGIKLEDWPLTDCSTSTRPVRDLVAYKLLGVPYKWEVDWMSGTTFLERKHPSPTMIMMPRTTSAARTKPI